VRSRALAVALAALGAAACEDRQVPTPEPANVARDSGSGDAASALDAGGTIREGVVRIATFNVRRFFDTTCDSRSCDDASFEQVATPVELQAKADAIAGAIAIVRPDVIALEEVESAACLDALQARLAKDGLAFPFAQLGETGAPGSVDVAVLTKGASTEVHRHRDRPLTRPDGTATTFSRELLEVRMSFGPRRVVVFAAHFRSKVDDDPGRRLAEATATRDIVTKVAGELPDALVVLGGDLNDTPGSPPLVALESGGALVRVASDLPADAQATYSFQGVDQAIDHLYVSAAQASRYRPGSATVFRDASRRGFAGSDHGALAADFDLR